MLEWAGVDDGARPKMLGRHDDPVQEYAYRPRGGLPDNKVGTLSDARAVYSLATRLPAIVRPVFGIGRSAACAKGHQSIPKIPRSG